MMHMTRGWTGFRTAVLALGLLAWSATHAAADTLTQDNILNFSTSGAIGTTGITGSNVISFVPVQDATVDTSSNLSLGYFQVAGLSPGQSTKYHDTPFTLTIVPSNFNSTAINDAPITITGHIDGTVTGPYHSGLQATFDPIANPNFAVPGGKETLSLLKNDGELLVPSSVNNGQTTVQASMAATASGNPAPTPLPEPSTIALFLSAVGGLGLRRFVQHRRQRAAA
jgi:hypothetical protein